MVRALLDGSKTQTRRIVKPTGAHHIFQFRGKDEAHGADEPTGEWAWCSSAHVVSDHIRCPYGKPGDRLWVRETWRGVVEINPPGKCTELGVARYVPDQQYCRRVEYQATHGRDSEPWRPSIHMPRWASRINLEVTGVRVERLDQITEDNAQAEGAAPAWLDVDGGTVNVGQPTYRQGFARLWRDINGDESWDANPWVWVVEFKRIGEAG